MGVSLDRAAFGEGAHVPILVGDIEDVKNQTMNGKIVNGSPNSNRIDDRRDDRFHQRLPSIRWMHTV